MAVILLIFFNPVDMEYKAYIHQEPFLGDILQLIAYLCNKHNRKICVTYITVGLFLIKEASITDDYKYIKLQVISEQDAKKLFEKINYTKVIPFDIRYCLRKNIKLPAKIKFLITVFDFDVVNEIAKYLYVICGK